MTIIKTSVRILQSPQNEADFLNFIQGASALHQHPEGTSKNSDKCNRNESF